MTRILAVLLFFSISFSLIYTTVGLVYLIASAGSIEGEQVKPAVRIARDDETLWI